MTTKVKSSATSRKGRKVSESVNASTLEQVVNAAAGVSAPAGAGVGSGAAAPAVGAVAVGAAGVASPAKVRQSGSSQLAAAIVREDSDLSVKSLCSRIAARFAAPEWAGAAALRSFVNSQIEMGIMSEDQGEKTLAAAARAAGVAVPICSAPRVLAVIRSSFRKDFESVCGCTFDSARSFFRSAGTGVFSLRLPLSLVQADSDINTFVIRTSLAAGASASAVVRSVLSFRFAAAFLAARSAAVAAAREDYLLALEVAVRKAQRLNYVADAVCTDLRDLFNAVPVADASDAARLNRTLNRQRKALAAVEYGNNGAARSDRGLLFYVPALFDDDFRLSAGAVLPAVGVPAAARKLWAKRERLLSAIATIENELARC